MWPRTADLFDRRCGAKLFFIYIRYAHAIFKLYAVYNLNRGCHWDIKLASFSPPAGKNAETGFMRSPVCPIKKKPIGWQGIKF
jgi:hypothetical protein